VEAYPYDINLITTLAELYEKNKDISSAIDTYKYAIEISKNTILVVKKNIKKRLID